MVVQVQQQIFQEVQQLMQVVAEDQTLEALVVEQLHKEVVLEVIQEELLQQDKQIQVQAVEEATLLELVELEVAE
jgi:Fe-S cluster assembly scaffold protein SufB